MIEAKIYVNNDLEQRFRAAAMRKFGMGRGALSKAIENSCLRWLIEEDEINGAITSIKEVASREKNILAIIIFGSYARKEPAFRDVDIGILLKETEDNQFEIEERFLNLLEGYNLKFDVNVINKFGYDVLKKIFSEGRIVYCSDKTAMDGYLEGILFENEEALARSASLGYGKE